MYIFSTHSLYSNTTMKKREYVIRWRMNEDKKKSKNMNVKCFDTFIQLSLLEYKYNCSSDMQYANYTYCVTHIISVASVEGMEEMEIIFFTLTRAPFICKFFSFCLGKCVMCLWRWKWSKIARQWRLANRGDRETENSESIKICGWNKWILDEWVN